MILLELKMSKMDMDLDFENWEQIPLMKLSKLIVTPQVLDDPELLEKIFYKLVSEDVPQKLSYSWTRALGWNLAQRSDSFNLLRLMAIDKSVWEWTFDRLIEFWGHPDFVDKVPFLSWLVDLGMAADNENIRYQIAYHTDQVLMHRECFDLLYNRPGVKYNLLQIFAFATMNDHLDIADQIEGQLPNISGEDIRQLLDHISFYVRMYSGLEELHFWDGAGRERFENFIDPYMEDPEVVKMYEKVFD